MVKVMMGARSLILNYNTWTAFDAQGQPWPEGVEYARKVIDGVYIFSQVPDMELARAQLFVEISGGRIVEHIPNPNRAPYVPGGIY